MTLDELKELKKHLYGTHAVGDDLAADETEYLAALIDREIAANDEHPIGTCGNCGGGLMDSYMFCPYCGEFAKTDHAPNSTPAEFEQLRQKMTLFTGAKGEGGVEFTFQDFYTLEALIDHNVLCPSCGKTMHRKKITTDAVWGEYHQSIDKVPSHVCDCGEIIFSAEVVQMLESVAIARARQQAPGDVQLVIDWITECRDRTEREKDINGVHNPYYSNWKEHIRNYNIILRALQSSQPKPVPDGDDVQKAINHLD
jgi:YgiT-type zinc finger domain-containing protein